MHSTSKGSAALVIPVYCVHLPNPERKARIAAELDKAGFTDITYVHAQEPFKGFTCNNMRRNPRGEFGCALSHVKAIVQAIIDDCDRALFVEDDIVFSDDAAARLGGIRGYLRPLYYNVLYLGGHPREAVSLTGHPAGLVACGRWSCAEAYSMARPMMDRFLQFWLDRAGQPNAMFDFILGEFASSVGKSYAFYPPLTHQPTGYSYIGGKVDDKSKCIEKGWRENLVA